MLRRYHVLRLRRRMGANGYAFADNAVPCFRGCAAAARQARHSRKGTFPAKVEPSRPFCGTAAIVRKQEGVTLFLCRYQIKLLSVKSVQSVAGSLAFAMRHCQLILTNSGQLTMHS